jgi:hypothetical protein
VAARRADTTLTTTIHATEGEPIRIPESSAGFQLASSLLSQTAGTFTADHQALLKSENGFLTITGLKPGDYSLKLADQLITIKVTKGSVIGGWALGKHRQLELKGNRRCTSPASRTTKTSSPSNSPTAARLRASMSLHRDSIPATASSAVSAASHASARLPARPREIPNLYSAGREIGDEYRYILERRYAKLFPGNMLTRPGLLLNPWEIRSTDLDELAQLAGEGAP